MPDPYESALRAAVAAHSRAQLSLQTGEAVGQLAAALSPARARRRVPPFRRGGLRRTRTVPRAVFFRAAALHGLAAAKWAACAAAAGAGVDAT